MLTTRSTLSRSTRIDCTPLRRGDPRARCGGRRVILGRRSARRPVRRLGSCGSGAGCAMRAPASSMLHRLGQLPRSSAARHPPGRSFGGGEIGDDGSARSAQASVRPAAPRLWRSCTIDRSQLPSTNSNTSAIVASVSVGRDQRDFPGAIDRRTARNRPAAESRRAPRDDRASRPASPVRGTAAADRWRAHRARGAA